ncbi:MAG: hypothetical protein BGO98_02350 [Myxococcales bacterium 68-20]|nr:MAG: hypothetical protein BGO98_02350 [Myxococcales bacterium 68-20]
MGSDRSDLSDVAISAEPGHSYYGALVAMRQVRVAFAKRSIRQRVDFDTKTAQRAPDVRCHLDLAVRARPRDANAGRLTVRRVLSTRRDTHERPSATARAGR